VDGDGFVNGVDLAALLAAWGTDIAAADFNLDGIIDGSDMTVVLSNFD
jgi:hypothetical protein